MMRGDMAIPAVAAPLVILRRRRIGAIVILLGVVAVAAGLLLPLAGLPTGTQAGNSVTTPVVTITVPNSGSVALLTGGTSSGLDLVRHTLDHPLLGTGSLGSMVVDIAQRGGMILILAGAFACLAFNVIPLMRGLVGVAAGIGLMGAALEMGVILGQGARAQALCAGVACHIDLRAGIWVIVGGFAVALVGGAIGALRPLAGLVSGVGFAFTGAVLGSGVAFLIVHQKVLDVAASVAGSVPR